MTYILETDRLLLRQFSADDADFILALVNSPGWLQYIGDRNIKSEAQAKSYLENGPVKSYAANGFGLWLVELKPGASPIGMCGILKRDDLDYPDLGFAFLPAFTGQGFALEVARATLAFAKEKLQLPVVLAITVTNNSRSINLLEKAGLHFSKLIWSANNDKELMLFTNKELS